MRLVASQFTTHNSQFPSSARVSRRGEIDDFFDQLCVVASGLSRRQGELRFRGEPWIGVGFDDGDAAVRPQAHVDAGVVTQLQRLEDRQRGLLQQRGGLFGKV